MSNDVLLMPTQVKGCFAKANIHERKHDGFFTKGIHVLFALHCVAELHREKCTKKEKKKKRLMSTDTDLCVVLLRQTRVVRQDLRENM